MDKKWGNGWETVELMNMASVCECVCVVNLVQVVFIFKVKKDIKDK